MQRAVISFLTNPKKIRIWYVCSFLLLIISLSLTHYVTKKLLDQSQEIATTDASINNLELTLSYIKDAETGLRGYIIMKDAAYLQPLTGSRQKADSVYLHLVQQLTNSTPQQQNLQQLHRLIGQRYAHIYSALDTFTQHGLRSEVFREKKMMSGKIIMDSLRRIVNKMQLHERTVMAEKQARMAFIYRVVTSVNVASLIISVLLAFFVFYTYTKENRARQEADEKAADYRKRLEIRIQELRTANAELLTLRSNEKFSSTGRIARTIAHEVRNPLTNINLAAEHLQEEVPGTHALNSMLGIIKRNSLRIQQLITDLLNSTRFAELRFEKLQVNDILNQALQQAQDRLTFQNVQVVKSYQADLVPILVDGEKLKLAFLNIIVNAVEAMQVNTGILTIDTFADATNCVVAIADNGCGMSKETVQRLFEPYFTQKTKGTGLGMTNTQNIILNHKGTLEVESIEGSGTTFTIRLPLSIG